MHSYVRTKRGYTLTSLAVIVAYSLEAHVVEPEAIATFAICARIASADLGSERRDFEARFGGQRCNRLGNLLL